MYLKIFLLIMLAFLPVTSFAKTGVYESCYYETGDKISISVSGQVSKDADKGIFSYNYTVKSNPQSEQNVWVFKIILPEKNIIINAMSPTGWGKPGWSGKPTKYSQMRDIMPPYWIGWPAPEENQKPSETVSGFLFETFFGLPGIVDYYTEGESVAQCPEGMAVDFIPGYHDLTPYGPGIVGRTIAPTAPPADFKPIDFLDYIISLKHEAYKLGWIIQGKDNDKGKKDDEEKGIIKSLDKKLEKAREKLEKGDTKEAIEKIKSFIHEVEALYKEDEKGEDKDDEKETKDKKGKKLKKKEQHEHLTSEAYGLLKYNAQHLIEQLGGEKKEKEAKEKEKKEKEKEKEKKD